MNQSSNPNTSSVEINTHTIVDVDWLDAVCTGGSEWQTQEEVTEAVLAGPSRVRSVGYLIHEDDNYIAIVDTIITDGDSCGYVHVIPRGMVRSIRRLNSVDY